MYYGIRYGVLFLVVLLLQVLLFNNLDLSMYISPVVYIAFVILLPIELASIYVLLLGLVMGAIIDVSMLTVGINTIASLFTAFFRQFILLNTIGKELYRDGGVPSIQRLGFVRLFKYISCFCLVHCIIFFSLETLSIDHALLTLLQIIFSSLFSAVLVFFISLAFQHKPILRL